MNRRRRSKATKQHHNNASPIAISTPENMSSNGDGNSSTNNKSDHNDEEDNRFPDEPFLIRTLSNASGPQHHSLIGIVLITLGSFSFSCMFLFVKLMEGKANSFTVAFYRALVEIPIAIYLCDGKKVDDFLGPPSARGWLLVRGGMGGAAVLCFFYAIQHLSLPDAVTLQFTTPPFAAGFAVIFAGEQWKCLDMIGAVVCLIGVMLIAHPTWLFGTAAVAATAASLASEGGGEGSGEVHSGSAGAIAIAILGAAFAGMAYMSVRMIGQAASANVMVLYYSCLSMPVTLLGSRCLLGNWNVWGGGHNLSLLDWIWILFTGLTAYAGQYLINLGLQHESAATGTLATCSQIVFTYIFELVFLHEGINLWSVAGTILILGFMMIVGITKMKVADEKIHETVAGETEELALLFSAECGVRQTTKYNKENTEQTESILMLKLTKNTEQTETNTSK